MKSFHPVEGEVSASSCHKQEGRRAVEPPVPHAAGKGAHAYRAARGVLTKKCQEFY